MTYAVTTFCCDNDGNDIETVVCDTVQKARDLAALRANLWEAIGNGSRAEEWEVYGAELSDGEDEDFSFEQMMRLVGRWDGADPLRVEHGSGEFFVLLVPVSRLGG